MEENEDSIAILNRIVRRELEKLDHASGLPTPLGEDDVRILLGVYRILAGGHDGDEGALPVSEPLTKAELSTLKALRAKG